MHYLIDGHNLIAKIPTISLDDPYDEAKLVFLLKGWAAGSRKRRITVIFDGGMPGGKVRSLSNSAVTVVFAPYGQTADSLLIRRIKKVKNPPEYTLVSSDHRIIAAAKKRRMRYRRSETFATRLSRDKRPSSTSPSDIPLEKTDDPQVSKQEVDAWLALFGPVPERPSRPPKRRPKAVPPPEEKPAKKKKKRLDQQDLAAAKSGDRELDEEEVDAWLEMFGGEPKRPSPPAIKPPKPRQKKKKPGKRSSSLRTDKSGDAVLSEEEIEEWLRLFGE